MRKVLITGGAGFIGSHIVDQFAGSLPDCKIVVLDKMTYAADFRNLSELLITNRIELAVGDICDYDLCERLVEGCDLVIHAAAESHVDNSFHSSLLFTNTNVLGTHTILEACRSKNVPRIVHISTDEVYGEVLSGAVDESAQLNPTNPYSASKAAAEMIVNGYIHSFKLPVVMVRANNVFGTRQYPEKLIPRCCLSLIQGKKIPLHGNGKNVRHYLAAKDLAAAIELISHAGELHEIYNIGSPDEFTNIEVAGAVCNAFGLAFEDHVEFIKDRPFNDRRYAVVWDKITAMGWRPKYSFRDEVNDIAGWYRRNHQRYT
ncbi:dTDP-glucose 4,6-dehydratase [Aquidulcibacter paucihalophilus]|nr:dTDP-glucose 4,6-dehydratase [Aquidulcibacter paucihalophilus]